MSPFDRIRLPILAVAALALLTTAPAAVDRDPRVAPTPPPDDTRAASEGLCGTDWPLASSRPRVAEATEDGVPLWYQQDPPILMPTHTGDIRLREFLVLGDVAEVAFWLNDPEGTSTRETWPRQSTRNIAGRLVSVFEPSWRNEAWRKHLRRTIRGFDHPSVAWGSLEYPGRDPVQYAAVRLRVGSTAIEPAPIVRIDETAQYSSHVVNLVVPDFGNARITEGSKAFDQRRVSWRFHELFAPEYESLAIVPATSHLATYGAFHGNIGNEVEGTGMNLMYPPPAYRSSRLRSVEVYPQTAFPTNATSNHEIGHQWGHYFAWERLGITRDADDDRAHAPLWFPGETFISGVLAGTRRVRQIAEATFAIEATPPPVRWHPLDLYAMGLATPDQVPDLMVFDDQGQFAGSGTPTPGTLLSGGVRRVTINDLLGQHGSRRGPVDTIWRRATIVVSRDRLISPEEMSYWNFFAARHADPARTGIMSYDGYPGFDASTDGRIDLQSQIVPLDGPPLPFAAEVSAPRFGRFDCPDVEFAASLPTTFRVGQEVRVEGRTVATDQRFDSMLLRFWKPGGSAADAVLVYDSVSASGSFSPRVLFREGEEGAYYAQLFVFWPGAPPQYPRCTLSPVIVTR